MGAGVRNGQSTGALPDPCRPPRCVLGATRARRPRAGADPAARALAASRSDLRSSARQAAVTAARPRAAAAAPPTDVPYTTRTTGTSTQLNAAQRTTSLAESADGPGECLGRAAVSCTRRGALRRPRRGTGEGTGGGPGGRAGTKAPWRQWDDRGATRSGVDRSPGAASDGLRLRAGSAPGRAQPPDGALPPDWPGGGVQTAVDAKRHCHTGRARACSLERRGMGQPALGRRGVSPYPWGYGAGKMIPGHSSTAMPAGAIEPPSPRRSLPQRTSSPRHRWPVTKTPNPRTASR